jgi:hypothetical protein
MKKIALMLLGVAATISVMAVDYTAYAVVTLQSESGYSCELTLRQADEFGALNGAEMNMDDRHIALYALNGAQKLQIAKAADLSNLHIGLLSDASTNYTITVSDVEGETLYLYDGDDDAYALTEGASYNFTAAPNATDEARFSIKKSAPVAVSICFNYNILKIKGHAGENLKVEKDGVAIIAEAPLASDNESFDLSAQSGRLVVTLNGKEYQIDANPAVTVVP